MTESERIGEIGEYYPAETIAKTDILFNRFVARGTDLEDIIYADSSHEAIGLAEFDYRGEYIDKSTRLGWKAGQEMAVKGNGWGYVVAGEDLQKDDLVTPGANGVASKYTRTTPSATYAEAEADAVAIADVKIKGKVLIGATTGNLAKIQLKNCL